jgi:hypothetical protein
MSFEIKCIRSVFQQKVRYGEERGDLCVGNILHFLVIPVQYTG